MNISIEISENDLRRLVLEYMQEKLGDVKLDHAKVKIEVKSKQNYKSE